MQYAILYACGPALYISYCQAIRTNIRDRIAVSPYRRIARITTAYPPRVYDAATAPPLDVMDDPVIAADGVTYDRAAIEEWFETTKEVTVTTYVKTNILGPSAGPRTSTPILTLTLTLTLTFVRTIVLLLSV